MQMKKRPNILKLEPKEQLSIIGIVKRKKQLKPIVGVWSLPLNRQWTNSCVLLEVVVFRISLLKTLTNIY